MGVHNPNPRERAKWRHQPDWFVTHRLGVTLRQQQKQLLKALSKNELVAVSAPNGSGKTYAAALAVIWWLMAHDEAIAITTAPTERQVRNQIWREIRAIHLRKNQLIGGAISNTKLEFGERHFALGFATNSDLRFQGFHAENILVVADEAADIREKIFDAIFACLTSKNAKLLILGNPAKPQGTLHNALNKHKPHWKTLQT